MPPTSISRVSTPEQVGALVRARRKVLRLTQIDAAALCNVSPRLLGELERGRPSVGIGLVLRVAATLGLDVTIAARGSPG
jgi:HTH-type transcriptional regulator/antitoxin HipB